jgi:hypothetical protein
MLPGYLRLLLAGEMGGEALHVLVIQRVRANCDIAINNSTGGGV